MGVAGLRLLFGRIESGDHRRNRLVGILQGVITNLGSKLVGMVVSFLSVPLTIGYLGPERYGAWLTLGSLLAWLGLTDFGLGNGLANAITTAAGQDRTDIVRMHVSNGIFLLGVVAIFVGAGVLVAWPFIRWSTLFGLSSPNARAEIGPAVGAALIIFLVQMPLAVTAKIFLAYREGRISNYWSAAGNVLSLLALVAVTHTRGGLVWLVIAVFGTSVLVNGAGAIWLFLWHRPMLSPRLSAIRVSSMRSLTGVGGQFFLIQIMALVTFQTDNLVISHFLGAASVPEYSLTYRLFNYTSLPQTILFVYLWSAYTEAISRKDIRWVSRVFHLNLMLGMIFTCGAAIGLALIAKPFIGWWGGHWVAPSSALIGWTAGWSVINAFTNPMACLLAAASHLRAQLIYSAIATSSNIGLSIYLVQLWGVQGVIAATVISYAVFICVPVLIDVELLLKRLRHAV
jgi:O-antigen/teichoic acid export membrane protein